MCHHVRATIGKTDTRMLSSWSPIHYTLRKFFETFRFLKWICRIQTKYNPNRFPSVFGNDSNLFQGDWINNQLISLIIATWLHMSRATFIRESESLPNTLGSGSVFLLPIFEKGKSFFFWRELRRKRVCICFPSSEGKENSLLFVQHPLGFIHRETQSSIETRRPLMGWNKRIRPTRSL